MNMNIGEIILVLIGIVGTLLSIVCFFYGMFNLCRGFWSLFNHSKVPKNAVLSLNAKIIDISSQKVKYVKNGAKYKTTVLFSDGFEFITHKTNREDNIFTYEISVDTEQITENAIKAHDRALKKQK